MPLYFGSHGGAYTDHETWRTPGPHWTPLRVTPREPAAAGAVIGPPLLDADEPPDAVVPPVLEDDEPDDEDPPLETCPVDEPVSLDVVPPPCPADVRSDLCERDGINVAINIKTMSAPRNGL